VAQAVRQSTPVVADLNSQVLMLFAVVQIISNVTASRPCVSEDIRHRFHRDAVSGKLHRCR
jgi:hypothetical protein